MGKFSFHYIFLAFMTIISGCNGAQKQVDENNMVATNENTPLAAASHEGDTITIFPYRKDNRWIYVDKNKEMVIPRWFDFAYPFNEHGLALVRKIGKIGYIDTLGNEVVPMAYDKVLLRFYNGLSVLEKEGEQCVINAKGETVVPLGKYDEISGFRNNYSQVEKDGKHGMINRKGEEVIPLIYDEMEINNYNNDRLLVGCYKGAIGDGVAGFVSAENEEVLPFKYFEIKAFSENLVAYRMGQGEKFGYMDQSGKTVVEEIYSDPKEFWEGRAVVTKDGKKGVIDKTGKVILPFEYDDATFRYINGLLTVKKDNKWGAVGLNGEVIIPMEYDQLEMFEAGDYRMLIALQNGKYGVLDYEGNVVIPFEYESEVEGYDISGIRVLSAHIFRVKKDGRFGLVDRKNNKITPLKYDALAPYLDHGILDGLIEVKFDGKPGFIDLSGNEYFEYLQN